MEKILTLDKISSLIDEKVEENLHLDYKAAAALGKTDGKKNEISKDVSSFANSDGGILIYGIKEYDEKGMNHLPKKSIQFPVKISRRNGWNKSLIAILLQKFKI